MRASFFAGSAALQCRIFVVSTLNERDWSRALPAMSGPGGLRIFSNGDLP
jgi:hypothetical protein